MQALVPEQTKVLSLRDFPRRETVRPTDARPLVTGHFAFAASVPAFDCARAMRPASVKVTIALP